MLELAYPAKQDDDVILKVRVRCRACLTETHPLVPVSRQPAGRSDRAYFMARQLWHRMPFRCGCGHTAADLLEVEYAKAEDLRWTAPKPKPEAPKLAPAPVEPEPVVRLYGFARPLAVKPDLFPNLGLPRLMRCA